MKRLWIPLLLLCLAVAVYFALRNTDPIRHVYPGESIQAALDAAAADRVNKHVVVHAGTYRPNRPGQAFVWFNEKHTGVMLEADGKVVLSGANPAIADKNDESYPCIVNHVVYFGDGVWTDTTFRGFTIRGANNFVTHDEFEDPIQPAIASPDMERELYFYCDGGGIKVFGRSYPKIENVTIEDCYSSPCGAGVSIEHRGANITQSSVQLINCVFRGNRVPATGAAVDLLWGSRATITNCLFVGNLSNEPMDERSRSLGFWKKENGAGALTILPYSIAKVERCTFIGNRNAVDDSGLGSEYRDSIFWENNASGGWPEGSRYELDVVKESRVIGCKINGDTPDLGGTVDPTANDLNCIDPQFDNAYVPKADGFQNVGYRPAEAMPLAK